MIGIPLSYIIKIYYDRSQAKQVAGADKLTIKMLKVYAVEPEHTLPAH